MDAMTYHLPPRVDFGLEMSHSPEESASSSSHEPNGSSSSSTSTDRPDLNLPIVYTVLEACVAVSAVFGNLLVIVVFLQDRRLRKVTNFYIISLSIADLLVGAIGIPSAILTRIGMPRNSIRLCLTMLSLLVVLCTISILNLVAVSLDRYWAILHPLDYHKRISEKTALAIICVCWILGSAIGFLPLFGWNNGHLATDECFFIPIMNYDFLMFLYFVTIVLPAVVMAFFYIRIYIVVVQQLSLNKVRHLNSNEFSLSKLKPAKSALDSGMSYSSHFTRNTRNVFKLSSPAFTPHNSVHRFKSFKSASSPQQLNEIDVRQSDILPCAANHQSTAEKPPSAATFATDSFDSLSFSPLRMANVSTSTQEHSQKHKDLHRCSHHVLRGTEKPSKERKWMSLWSMRNLNDGLVCVCGESRPVEKKHSTGSSIISSFYRNSNGGSGKLSYSRREVKKAQKLFVIVVFFMLCWLPLYTSNTIQAFCHHCPTPSATWLDFLIILSHINSAGSPFLYAFHMKDFRQALRRLICKGAINKRKLRDLRREELFSISGRRQTAGTGAPFSVGVPDTNETLAGGKSLSDYYLSKGQLCSHSANLCDRAKSCRAGSRPNGSKEAVAKQAEQHDRAGSKRHSKLPRCAVQIEVDMQESKEDEQCNQN